MYMGFYSRVSFISNIIANSAPSFTLLATVILPPGSSTWVLTINRPIPFPSGK